MLYIYIIYIYININISLILSMSLPITHICPSRSNFQVESQEEVAAAVLAHAQLLADLGTSLPSTAATAATTLLVAPNCGALRDFEVWIPGLETDGNGWKWMEMDGNGSAWSAKSRTKGPVEKCTRNFGCRKF